MSQRPVLVITPPMLADYPQAFAPLAALGVDVRINTGAYPMDSQALAAYIGDADAAIVGLDHLSADVFAACPKLRIVARNGVGVDNVDLDAATAHGVLITVPYGANSTSVAELALGLLLTLARRVIPTHARVQSGVWRREPGLELSGKTLGIIGLGRIGKRVAVRAQAFEMRVIANDIAPDEAFAAAHGIPFVTREALLAECDVLSLHVPLTPLTHHLINRPALAQMKPGAILINTARGPVIDARALADALDSGHLAGAALDVHTVEGQVEPFLLGRDNLITTTHLGAYTHDSLIKTTIAAVESLLQFWQQEAIPNLINPEAALKAPAVRVQHPMQSKEQDHG
jgi:D-3-phosphoglycerate dehydrogenase